LATARKTGKAMPHLVTAWASDNHLTLGQVACEEKSNEITAIPELLKLLSLKGCTVTIDAIGCQTAIAAQIREQKGHYVLALKGNQSRLQKDMQPLFDAGMNTGFAEQQHAVYQTTETGHGRTDERTCHVIEIPQDHPRRRVWKDLRTLAVTILAARGRGQRDVGIAPVREPSCSSRPIPREGDSSALVDRERTALGDRCRFRRRDSTATRSQRRGEPGRRATTGNQPAPAGDHPQARRQEQTTQPCPRPVVPPDRPSHGQILMRRPWS
jgi:predicted transposase YbfD/YdcC